MYGIKSNWDLSRLVQRMVTLKPNLGSYHFLKGVPLGEGTAPVTALWMR